MENILVLTNFSESARSAGESAVTLAENLGTDVILLNTYVALPVVSMTQLADWPMTDVITQEESKDLLEQEIAYLQGKLSGNTDQQPQLSYLQGEGSLAHKINQLVKEKNVKLVLMGGGQQNFLFGSHVRAVIGEINCPLIIVPQGKNNISLENISFATDLDLKDVKRISQVHQLLSPVSFQLHVCHVAISLLVPDFKEDDETTTFRDALNAENLPNTHFYALDDDLVIEALEKFTSSVKADLLIITHKKHNFFWRMFREDLSKLLLRKQKTPLLIMPENYRD